MQNIWLARQLTKVAKRQQITVAHFKETEQEYYILQRLDVYNQKLK